MKLLASTHAKHLNTFFLKIMYIITIVKSLFSYCNIKHALKIFKAEQNLDKNKNCKSN